MTSVSVVVSRPTYLSTAAGLRHRAGRAGDVAVTLGYYAIGDGGGRTFAWNTSSTATDDGGTIWKVASQVTGRWVMVDQAPISPRVWGARGRYNGADADVDTAATLAWVTYVVANKCAAVVDGTFMINGDVFAPLRGATGFAAEGVARTLASLGSAFVWCGAAWTGVASLTGTSSAVGANSLTKTGGGMTINAYAGYKLIDSLGVGWAVVSNSATAFVLNGEGLSPAAGAFGVFRDDSVLLDIRDHDGGSFKNIGFHGNALAKHVVRLRHYYTDVRTVRGWRFSGCYFGSAAQHSAIVEGTPYPAIAATWNGDACGLSFDDCHFAGPQGAITPTSHYRCTAANTFGVTFKNPTFSAALVSGTYYPSYALSLQAGTANVYGGVCDPLGVAAFHLDAAAAVPIGALTVDGVEVQTGNKLLVTDTIGRGGGQAIRPTTIRAVYAGDIVSPVATEMVYWDISDQSVLCLHELSLIGDVNVVSASALVSCAGAHLLSNHRFIGAGAARVFGTWWESGVPRQRLASPTLAVGLEGEVAPNTIRITATLPVDGASPVDVWISDTAGGVPTSTPPNVGASIGYGKLLKAVTANVYFRAIATSTQIALDVVETTAKSFYVNAALDHANVVSALITFA